jgi:hypothetical protein
MMTIRKTVFSLVLVLSLGGASLLGPRTALAQDLGDDFMFRTPKATLSFNLGYGVRSAGSDLFDEVIREFTLEKSDFYAPVIGGGISFFLNERMDLAFDFSYSKSSSWSEYSDFVGTDDFPIEQETQFTQVPVTASFRYFFNDRGRKIGNLSWIPTRWSPYIGVGGGRIWYEFIQSGEFIDFLDPGCATEGCPIYNDSVLSEGWAWVGHAFGGVQWALSPQWVITAEGRYSLADADLDRASFRGYEPLDLSGFQVMLGFGIRF